MFISNSFPYFNRRTRLPFRVNNRTSGPRLSPVLLHSLEILESRRTELAARESIPDGP